MRHPQSCQHHRVQWLPNFLLYNFPRRRCLKYCLRWWYKTSRTSLHMLSSPQLRTQLMWQSLLSFRNLQHRSYEFDKSCRHRKLPQQTLWCQLLEDQQFLEWHSHNLAMLRKQCLQLQLAQLPCRIQGMWFYLCCPYFWNKWKLLGTPCCC